MLDRNPSPPPGLSGVLQNVDRIGDTSYSRRWLYGLIIKLLQYIKKEDTHLTDNECEVPEIDNELESEMCYLWDLTVNREVLQFLEEFDLVSVLNSAIENPKNPRLLEICVGILANLVYDPSACKKMSENESLINRVISTMDLRDTPTLTEVCRLIQTALAFDEYKMPWLNEIHFQPGFFDNLLFILRSSTHGTLLISTIRLIDAITREDDSLAEVWCGDQLLESLLIAQHQMKWLHGDEVEIIHRLLYTFSSNINGVSALVNGFSEVLPTFGVYLRKVSEEEPHLMHFSTYYNSLRAMIPVIDVVIASLPHGRGISCCSCDNTVLPSLIHITYGCQRQLAEFPLARGILADLSVLYKDMISAIHNTIMDTDESNLKSLGEDIQWLLSLEADQKTGFREAFINCCLNEGDVETKAHLIAACNKLKLPKLLELITDD